MYAVVVVPTIATMAATPWAALEQLDVPVVIWAQVEDDPSPGDVPSLVFGSGPVGATAIGNVLARHGRSFAPPSARSRVGGRWRFCGRRGPPTGCGGRCLHTSAGDIWPGMLDVSLDRDRFAEVFGARFVDIEPEWSAPPAALPGDGAEQLDPDSRRPLGASPPARSLPRAGGRTWWPAPSTATDRPLPTILPWVWCAVPRARCLQATACRWPVPATTALPVALFLAQQFGGAAQYLELDAPKGSLGACLLTSGGEGDLRLAAEGSRPRACQNRFFSGLAGRGAAVEFVLRPGPVTLIGFTPIGDSFRVIAAHAEVLAEAPPELGIPRGYVSFPGGAEAGFDWWCEAGANHHLALTPGHHGEVVRAFAALHSIEATVLE